jgi:hypothetical protein
MSSSPLNFFGFGSTSSYDGGNRSSVHGGGDDPIVHSMTAATSTVWSYIIWILLYGGFTLCDCLESQKNIIFMMRHSWRIFMGKIRISFLQNAREKIWPISFEECCNGYVVQAQGLHPEKG